MFIPLWLRWECSSVGLRYALRQSTKTTLPPLNSSLQSAACYLRCRTGLAHGWLRREVANRNCYRTELVLKAQAGRFLSKINKLINNVVGSNISYVGLKIVGWCWTKWSPTFTTKRICKFFTDRPNPCLFRSGWCDNALTWCMSEFPARVIDGARWLAYHKVMQSLNSCSILVNNAINNIVSAHHLVKWWRW